MNAGIRIYLYRKGYMHTKTLVIDDQKDAELIDPHEWDGRPFIDKAKESVARVFSPVL